jgi:hypothetical protein
VRCTHGLKNQTDFENRSPVLLKTRKTDWFLVQNSIFNIWEKKQKTEQFSGLSIGFQPVFNLKFKFLMKTVN